MTIHMVKLCVGADDIGDLVDWQKRLMRDHAAPFHQTRMMPKRAAELTDGGSIYWVIRGVIQMRQPIVGVNQITDRGGRKACELIFDPELVRVEPTPKRAFQGWRYLQPGDAPADLRGQAVDAPPELMAGLKNALVW